MYDKKKLKRMSRAGLLELLLAQTQETERLQEELAQAKAELEEKRIRIQNAGDLAQAMLAVNGVIESAQAAAKQYLDNIAAMEAETKIECEKRIQEAEQIRREALDNNNS